MKDSKYPCKIPSRTVLLLGFLLLLLQTGQAAGLATPTTTSADASRSSTVRSVVSTKKNGGHSQTFTFHKTLVGGDDDDNSKVMQHRQSNQRSTSALDIVHNLQAGLRSTFLPSGFPLQTPAGYLQYSAWSWIQDLSTQLRAVLATQRVLEGVGVGRAGATALSAIMNFIVRDGCGMAATLLFTSVAASRFRTDIKRWRLFADVMVDIGITLEVAAAQVPTAFFLPMICVGNMCKAICGVAAGACGGAINLHWATGSDISDISAKFGAQHTVTGSLGLVFAALFAKKVSTVKLSHLWMLYSFLTALHIFANMRCMRLIAFSSLNTVRMNMVLADFFQGWSQQQQSDAATTVQSSPLASPIQISKQEALFFWPRFLRRKQPSMPIYFGVSFNEFSRQSLYSTTELEAMLLQDEKSYWISAGKSAIAVAIQADTSPVNQAKAYFHALLLARELQGKRPTSSQERLAVERAVLVQLDAAWNTFTSQCHQAGWDLTTCELRSKGYEIAIQR